MICKKCNKRHTNFKKGVCVMCDLKARPEKWGITDFRDIEPNDSKSKRKPILDRYV